MIRYPNARETTDHYVWLSEEKFFFLLSPILHKLRRDDEHRVISGASMSWRPDTGSMEQRFMARERRCPMVHPLGRQRRVDGCFPDGGLCLLAVTGETQPGDRPLAPWANDKGRALVDLAC